MKNAKMLTILVLGLVVFSLMGFAGNLEPSGPPGPTMKTLDEVEARIPIQSLSGDANFEYKIINPGSYYLTGNLTSGSAKRGILVGANYVTIDLNGYSLDGNGNGAGLEAIQIDAGMKYTTIRNGYIHNWSGAGINGEESERIYVENVHIDTVTNEAFFLVGASTAIGCSATNSRDGFILDNDCIATRCTARNNNFNGFSATSNCVVTECIATGNGTNGLDSMKTLDEVEPRIAIQSLSGDVDYEYIISSSGSYYLTGDVSTTKGGIRVDANDVTIDLMGYAIKGPGSGATNYGINMTFRSNVEVRNGTVRNFGEYGIFAKDFTQSESNLRIIDVRSIFNGIGGINLFGFGHLVKDCTVSNNGASSSDTVYGIYVWSDSTVTGNTVYDNGHSATGNYVTGISSFIGNRLTDNTVCGNGYSANSTVYGISGGSNSTVTGNTSFNNGYRATGSVYGISVNIGSTLTGNMAGSNGYYAGVNAYGIKAGNGSTVIGNTACNNGDSATGDAYGISLAGDNLVDQNVAYHNGSGAGLATNMTLSIGGCVYVNNVAPVIPP
jgi:parallel beta-helix repeat protein